MPARIDTQATAPTDAEIAREVKRRMKADLDVPDDRIAIKVSQGVVTISGIVARHAQKAAAEACAIKVKGATGIANKIVVGADSSAA